MARTARQCRERWDNHINQNLKKGAWSTDEDARFITRVLNYRKRWSAIVTMLVGRSEH
jgi:hypothetical protein